MIKNIFVLIIAIACVYIAGVVSYNKGFNSGVMYASECQGVVLHDGVEWFCMGE